MGQAMKSWIKERLATYISDDDDGIEKTCYRQEICVFVIGDHVENKA